MERTNDVRRLMSLVEDFIDGRRRSLEDAQTIEFFLDDNFPNDDEIQNFVSDFASYRPGGGEFLYDESEMTQKCKHLLSALANRLKIRE